MERSERRDLALVAAAFVIVHLLNLDALAVKSEDWTMLPAIRDMVGRGWGGILELLLRPRIEFAPHLIEGLIMRVFGLAPAPLFLFHLGAHGLSCALLYRVLRKVTGDEDLALAAALACLFIPTSASVVFYLTHSIFVFPVTMLLAMAHLYLYPLRPAWLDLSALSAAALAGQLSGEQTVPLFYAGFLLAGWRALAERPRRAYPFLRAAVPCAVSLLCMGWLVWRVTIPYMGKAQAMPHPPLGFVVSQLVMFHRQALDPTSWIFGRFAQPVSARTWLGSALLAGLLCLRFVRRPAGPEPSRPAPRGTGRLALLAAAGGCLFLFPILMTTMTGYRQGAMPKYTYGSGLCLALLLVLAADAALRRLLPAPARARRLAFAAGALYLGFLSHYAARELWGTQKRLDERIWSALDRSLAARPRFIILDGMQWGSSLVPNYRSIAYSDFAANGNDVPQRLKETHGYAPAVVTRWHRLRERPGRGPSLELVTWHGRVWAAEPEDVMAVVLRHDWSFRDLGEASPKVFATFAAYQEYRRAEPLSFPLDPRAYAPESW